MSLKVVGCELKEGDFNGNHFKYYNLYVVSSEKSESTLFGVCPHAVKLRSKFIEENDIKLKDFYQQNVEIYYDAYKNVVKIEPAA